MQGRVLTSTSLLSLAWLGWQVPDPSLYIPSAPCLTQVRLSDGESMDSFTFHRDYIRLNHNGGISLYENMLAVMAVGGRKGALVATRPILFLNP